MAVIVTPSRGGLDALARTSTGSGPFGFLGNIAEEARGIASGLAGLVGSGVHDVGRALGQAIPGRQDWGVISDNPADQYRLDDIALQLGPAILGDLATRYGPLLRGDLTEFGSQLYERPLSFGLDALAVGGAAAAGAKAAGTAALRGSEAASLAAREATGALAQAGVRRAAVPAGIRTGLDVLAGERPLTGLESLARSVLPRQTSRLVGDAFLPAAEAYNPVSRLALRPLQTALTRPTVGPGGLIDRLSRVDSLEKEIATLETGIKEAFGSSAKAPRDVLAALALKRGQLAEAQALGLSRVERPGVASLYANRAARRLDAKLRGEELATRIKATRTYEDELVPFLKEAPDLEDIGSAYPTGLDVTVPGYEVAEWFTTQKVRQGVAIPERVLQPVRVGAGGGVLTDGPPLTLSPTDDIATALQGANPIAQRTEAVAERLRALQERIRTDPDLTAAGWDAAAELDASSRLVSSLYEGARRALAHEQGDVVLPAGVRMTDRLRLLDAEGMIERLESVQIRPSQMLEESYRALRMKHGGTWDYDTGELVGGPAWQELDDAFRAAGEAPPTYYPFIRDELASKRASDFFSSKRLVGGNIAARDPHWNTMKGVLLMEGSYLRNPAQAYVRRVARGVRAQETYRRLMAYTRDFGRPITSTDELPPGYVVMAPDLLFLNKRSKVMFEDTLDDLLSKGVDRDAALAQAIEVTVARNQDDLARLLGDLENVKMWAVPKVAADRMEDAARYAKFLQGKARLGYDSVMDGWRGMVLAGSPRWLVNNFLGNSVFAAMQGAKTSDVIRALSGRFKEMLGGESKFLAEVRKLPGYEDVPSGFVGSTTAQYIEHRPALAATGYGRGLERVAATRAARLGKRFTTRMRQLNTVIEDSFRDASYLTAAERATGRSTIQRTGRQFMSSDRRVASIMESGFDEARAIQALNEVNSFFGNYGKMGAFERHVVRRWMVPFYGFYRHQISLLVRFPFEYPGRGQILNGLSQLTQEMASEYGPMPGWLEAGVPFGPPGQGEIGFFTGRGPNPFSATFEQLTDMLTPAIKIGLERARGESMFTGEPFTDRDIIRPYGTDEAFRIIRDEQGNPVDVQPLRGQPLPGILEHLLQQVPQYDQLKQLVAGGRTYDTATLLDALQGQAAVTDETGAPAMPRSLFDVLSRYAGLGLTQYDLQRWQERQEELRQAALSQAQG